MKSAPAATIAMAVALFALSRGYLLFGFQPDQSDTQLYLQYAWEDEVARTQGTPLYRFHVEQHDRATARARATGSPSPLPETRSIEYPPLALQPVLLAKRLLPRALDVHWDPRAWPLVGTIPGYERAFRAVIAGFDVLAFALLLWVVPRMYAAESAVHHLERWLTYIGAGHLLGHLLYDRLSLPPGAFVLAAVACLAARHIPVAAGLAWLACAVAYQLAPIVLLPLFVIACLPARTLQDRWTVIARALVPPGLLAGALVAAVFLAFHVREGPESLGFLQYHSQRGLQLESIAATLPLLLSFGGHAVSLSGDFGAWHLQSSLARVLAQSSPALMLLLVGGVVVLTVRAVRSPAPQGEVRFAAADAPLFAGAVVTSLAAAIVASKVFSPQYLLWMLPVVPLAPARRLLPLFLVIAAVTTTIFPYAYEHVAALTTGGKVLLVARNVLFVVFTTAAVLALRRQSV